MSETPTDEDLRNFEEELAAAEAQDAAEALRISEQKKNDIEVARYKSAAWDRASTALIGFGTLGPVLGLLWGTGHIAIPDDPTRAVVAIACLGLAIALHLIGRDILVKALEQ